MFRENLQFCVGPWAAGWTPLRVFWGQAGISLTGCILLAAFQGSCLQSCFLRKPSLPTPHLNSQTSVLGSLMGIQQFTDEEPPAQSDHTL